MKKFFILSTMLFISLVSYAQTSNLSDVISIKDAIAIYNGGIGIAKSKLTTAGYKYCGQGTFRSYWAKNCEYSKSQEKAIKFTKGTSSVIAIPNKDKGVTITVFNESAYKKIKSQIIAMGYKNTDSWGSSCGNYFETFEKSGYPKITASDESGDNPGMPFNINFEE